MRIEYSQQRQGWQQMDEPTIERQWITKEINPTEIAQALRGTLVPAKDADSKWNILLSYGKEVPLFILKLDPEKRSIFLAIPAPAWRNHETYYYTAKFVNIEDLQFVQYRNPDTDTLETDIAIRVRNSGIIDAEMIISSWAHRTFE